MGTSDAAEEGIPLSMRSAVVAIGYLIALLGALLGTVYLLPGLNFILFGGSADAGLGVVVQMVVAGALFAFATFVPLGTYILQS